MNKPSKPKHRKAKRGMSRGAAVRKPTTNAPSNEILDEVGAQRMAAVRRTVQRMEVGTPTPRWTVEQRAEGGLEIRPGGDPQISTLLLQDVFATHDVTFTDMLMSQVSQIARQGKTLTTRELNTTLSLVRGIGPKDETEAMLAVQMAAVHIATVVAARRVIHSENIPQQDSNGALLTKLTRTFAIQLEALKKYRSTGEQTVTVQHVTVNNGGQAIVAGELQPGGGGKEKAGDQPHGPNERSPRSTSLQSKI